VVEALAVALLAVAGCGGDSGPTNSAPPSHRSLLQLNVTGGKAGVFEELRVDRDGAAELSTGARTSGQRTAHFRLPPQVLAHITAALDAAKIGSLPARPPTGCADCFEYRISYRGTSYSADQSKEPLRLRAAISAIGRLITNAGSTSSSASGPSVLLPGR
jgi:hypothetical protein